MFGLVQPAGKGVEKAAIVPCHWQRSSCNKTRPVGLKLGSWVFGIHLQGMRVPEVPRERVDFVFEMIESLTELSKKSNQIRGCEGERN